MAWISKPLFQTVRDKEQGGMERTLALKSDGDSRIEKTLNANFADCKIMPRVNAITFSSRFSQSSHTSVLSGALILSQVFHVTQTFV